MVNHCSASNSEQSGGRDAPFVYQPHMAWAWREDPEQQRPRCLTNSLGTVVKPSSHIKLTITPLKSLRRAVHSDSIL